MALQYLLSPTFQFVNTAGKPMTGGAYLEVYVHGTRTKYFCASDFNGTLHPFRIPLDSLGSNIVLAQDSQAYDVYAYNRYGNLMMSRYNITPGSGGGIGGIIYSSDGSVQVVPTDNGIDLSVNGVRPTVLKVGAASLGTDGQFVFDLLQVEGEGLSVDNAGRIRMQPGWYHYDVTVELAWDENPRNASAQVSLYTTLSRSVIELDLSFRHSETIQFSGDVHCVEEGAQMVFGVSGMPTGLVASVIDAGMHSITGKTGDGSRYLAGEGINIDANNYISADLEVVQEKLEAGSNISIVGNVISATAEPQQPADWAATEGVTRILNKPDLGVYATHSEVTYGLAQKQDTISDLSTIRSGAAAGATAVQPAAMDAALAGKQDVISDLSDIRSGASAGATAVQPADMNTALAGKQDVISDLSTIRSGAAAGATAVQPADMNTALAGKENAANKSQTLDPTSTTEFPSSAATASFVNSSVATNTATFRGNFKLADLGLTYPATNAQIEAALDAHTWPVGVVPTNNDYVYVEIENPQTTGIDDVVERFKYDGSYWHYEYTLNNSSFTAAEKAAIDSGIDSAKVAIYDAHVANGDIHVTATEKATWNAKQDAISDLSTIRSGAAAGATAVQPGDLATVATTGAFSDLTGTPTVDQTYSAASANAQSGVAVASAISGKQDTISDLATIRSGAAAGATAVQPGDLSAVATTGAYSDLSGTPTIPTVDQTYSASSTNAQSGVAVASAIAGVNAVPASTSSDADKVLTVDAQGVPGWANAQAPISAGSGIDITNNVVSAKVDGTSVSFNAQGQLQSAAGAQADWAETDPADPSYIVAKPVPKMLAAGNGISITENQSTITIANTSTVDQTYDASSANAQSGVAVASGIADAIGDLPTNLTAAQILALKQALGCDETVLWSGASANATLSELPTNFERIRIEFGTPVGTSGDNIGRGCTEVSMDFINTANDGSIFLSTFFNGDGSNHVPYYTSGYVIGVRTLNWQTAWTVWGNVFSTVKQTSSSWFLLNKIVGIHRIASN